MWVLQSKKVHNVFKPMWIDHGNLVRWDSKYYNNCTFFCFHLQHTHYPQYAGPGAAGRSLRGPFGDALLELDNTIGNLLTTLEKTGVINNTLVFFTSDNGLGFCPCFVFICKWIYGLHVFAVTFILSYADVLIPLHISCGTVVCFSSVQRLSVIFLLSFTFDLLPSYDVGFIVF